MQRRRRSLGRAVDECVKESTEEWFRQHRGHRTREEARVEDWRKLSTTTDLARGGFLTVYVGIVTRDRNTTQMDITHFRWCDSEGFLREDNHKAVG